MNTRLWLCLMIHITGLELLTNAARLPKTKPHLSTVVTSTDVSTEQDVTLLDEGSHEITTDIISEEDKIATEKYDNDGENINTPSEFLLPPLPEAVSEFRIVPDLTPSDDWTPMVTQQFTLPKVSNSILFNPDALRTYPVGDFATDENLFTQPRKEISIPSRFLLPPYNNQQEHTFYVPQIKPELIPPYLQAESFNPKAQNNVYSQHTPVADVIKGQPVTQYIPGPLDMNSNDYLGEKDNALRKNHQSTYLSASPQPTLSLELKPPSPPQYKIPTKLYPKKYKPASNFKPMLIPVREFADGNTESTPKARPVKLQKISTPKLVKSLYKNEEQTNNPDLLDEKELYEDEKARKTQEELDFLVEDTFGNPHYEQLASESGHRHGYSEGDSYSAPSYGTAQLDDGSVEATPAPGERTEFRMHGLEGPNSYKFGYDTGKGKNRQFRYEERSNDGHVKGQYGYMDRTGKMKIVKYDAHPQHGFRAEGPFEKS